MSQEEKRPRRSEAQRRRKMPLTGYMVILFAVAFLLLFMAYCQQQRQNTEAANDALKKSVSAVDTIQTMLEDNQALRSQVAELEAQAQAAAQLQQEKEGLESQVASLERRADAMQYFWQIDDYYARKYYTQAKQLIQTFEALGLKEYLEQENTTGTDRFSPARRYQEIYDALY